MNRLTEPLTIGRVADAAGVGVETVRFYERKGLVPRPRRPQQGFRAYPADTVARIRFIRQAQELGFTLREIRDLMSLRADPRADCGSVRVRAETKLADVTAKMDRLKKIRRALEILIAACPGSGAIASCSILDGFDQSRSSRSNGVARRKQEAVACLSEKRAR